MKPILNLTLTSLLALGLFTSCSSNKTTEKKAVSPVSDTVNTEAGGAQAESQGPGATAKPKSKITSVKDWSGNYQNESGNVLSLSGPAPDGGIEFKMSQGKSGCVEVIEGTAYLIEPAVAAYVTENACHISFDFKTAELQVTEHGCVHGSNCGPFGGVYRVK